MSDIDQDNNERKLRFEQKQLWLQTVQTVVVVIGVAFAMFELNNALSERHQGKYEITAQMLSRFAETSLIDGANAFLEAGQMEPTNTNYNMLLARLTPLRQHLITWSACLAEDICFQGPTRILFCRRLIAYEYSVKSLMKRFGKSYLKEERNSHYFGEFEKCEKDQAQWMEVTFQ